jgi:hypothetical protein
VWSTLSNLSRGFTVAGTEFYPYYLVQEKQFEVYPAFEPNRRTVFW